MKVESQVRKSETALISESGIKGMRNNPWPEIPLPSEALRTAWPSIQNGNVLEDSDDQTDTHLHILKITPSPLACEKNGSAHVQKIIVIGGVLLNI